MFLQHNNNGIQFFNLSQTDQIKLNTPWFVHPQEHVQTQLRLSLSKHAPT